MVLFMRCWLVVFLIPSIAAAEWKVTDRQESKAGSAHAFVITVSNSSVQAKIHAVTDGPSEVRFRVLNNADRRFVSWYIRWQERNSFRASFLYENKSRL